MFSTASSKVSIIYFTVFYNCLLLGVDLQDIVFDEAPPLPSSSPAASYYKPTPSSYQDFNNRPNYQHTTEPEIAERRPQFGGFGNQRNPNNPFAGFNPPRQNFNADFQTQFQNVVRNPLQSITNSLQNLANGFINQGQNNRNPLLPNPIPPPRRTTTQPPTFQLDEFEIPEPDCQTFRNTEGYCMPLPSCTSLRNVLANRPQITQNRILRRSICGFSGFNSLVCCPEPNGNIQIGSDIGPGFSNPQRPNITPRPPIKLIPEEPSHPRPTPFPFEQIRSTTPKETFPEFGPGPIALISPKPTFKPATPITQNQDDIEIRNGCGFSNASHSRIVGGKEAPLGAWPWIAALGYSDTTSGSINYLCGGALISRSHVLTAGHCVHKRPDLKTIRLGDHDLFSDGDNAKPFNVEIDQIIPSPKYNPSTFQNDIAIIKLKKPVEFTLQVHSICLPSSPDLRSERFEGRTPFVAGWGSIQFNGPSSAALREVQVPVVSDSACQDKYKPFKNTKVDETNICAGYQRGGQDACQGDSGGPLMQPTGNDKYTIIGVVSFGFKCAEPGFPGVYSRVTSHMDWIEQTIAT